MDIRYLPNRSDPYVIEVSQHFPRLYGEDL